MAFRDLALRNFWLKISALALAIVVWFTFSSGELKIPMTERILPYASSRKFVRHPVMVARPGGDIREFKLDPDEVDIVLTGEELVLKRIRGEEIYAFVDPTGVKDAEMVKVQVVAPAEVRAEANPVEVRLHVIHPATP
jgi:hypothetical protein